MECLTKREQRESEREGWLKWTAFRREIEDGEGCRRLFVESKEVVVNGMFKRVENGEEKSEK